MLNPAISNSFQNASAYGSLSAQPFPPAKLKSTASSPFVQPATDTVAAVLDAAKGSNTTVSNSFTQVSNIINTPQRMAMSAIDTWRLK
jgi:hypothetical protein